MNKTQINIIKKIKINWIMNQFLPRHLYEGEDNGKSTHDVAMDFCEEFGCKDIWEKDELFKIKIKRKMSQYISILKDPSKKWYMRGLAGKKNGRGYVHFFINTEEDYLKVNEERKNILNGQYRNHAERMKDSSEILHIPFNDQDLLKYFD